MARDKEVYIPSALDSQERWAGEITSIVKRLVSDVVSIQDTLETLRIETGKDEQAGENRAEKIRRLEKCVTDLYNKISEILQSCAAKHGELNSIINDIRALRADLVQVSRDLQAHTNAYNTAVTRLQASVDSFKETEKTVSEIDKTISNWKGRLVVIMIIAGAIPAIIDMLWQFFKK